MGSLGLGEGSGTSNKVLVRRLASQQAAPLAGAGKVPSSNPSWREISQNRAAVSCLPSASALTTSRYCS